MENFSSIVMAIATGAAFILAGGGLKLGFKRQSRVRGILMIVAALVIVMNVMIWTV